METIESLSSVIRYVLVDMSYKGDYIEIIENKVPLNKIEKKEIKDMVGVIEGWEIRKGEE